MRVIILSFILLVYSCCPIDNNNSIQKEDKIVVNSSIKYKIYRDKYGTVAILSEFELREHIFLINTWNNNNNILHAPWCPCRQTQCITTTESIFESNSYF